MRPCKNLLLAAKSSPKLNKANKKNVLDKSRFIPKLPIPTVESTLNRYLASLSAQEQTIGLPTINKAKRLPESEKPIIEKLHEMLLDYDASIGPSTSYITADWREMYLKDRSGLPFNVTPFIGIKSHPNPEMNEMTLRAANLAISAARMCLKLEKEMLQPVRDMSQFKHLFRSTRIPRKGMDTLTVTPATKHVSFQACGLFYKLDVLNFRNEILDFDAVHKGVQEIYSDAKNRNHDRNLSIGYLSATNRDTWAISRSRLEDISESNKENLKIIDGSIIHFCLEDAVVKPFKDDVELLTKTMLWGDGASRWWDKSISWIVTGGGDAGLTAEHSWGDGLAKLTYFNETLVENVDDPKLVEPCGENTESSSWNLLSFELDDCIEADILRAKTEYDLNATDINISAASTVGIGRSFFKQHNLSPDAMVQLAIQAAWQHCKDGEVCPVYEACSTASFRGGRTENLRPCTVESVQAARMLRIDNIDGDGLKKAIRAAGAKHDILKNDAQIGHGFDRHIFGMLRRAEQAGIAVPELFSDDTFGYMNHFKLSTSTLDSKHLTIAGFHPVVPEGLGVWYGFFEESMKCNVLSRKSTQQVAPEDFSRAFVDSLQRIKTALEGDQFTKSST